MSSKPHPAQRIATKVPANPHPGRLSPRASKAMSGWLGRIIHYSHRPHITGWEHLPASGPYMVVANHSGGGVAEVWCLALRWHQRFGTRRPLAGMAQPMAMAGPPFGRVLRALGAIPSSYKAAEKTLASGIPVLIFPGGDHEAFRPIWQANQVDLAGRVGFLRIAARADIPIVPLAIRGSHYTMPILWRSRWLPKLWLLDRLLGIKRVPITLHALLIGSVLGKWVAGLTSWPFGALFALAVVSFPLMFFTPWVPWRISGRFGAPVTLEELGLSDAGSEADLDSARAKVEYRLQQLLDELGSTPNHHHQ